MKNMDRIDSSRSDSPIGIPSSPPQGPVGSNDDYPSGSSSGSYLQGSAQQAAAAAAAAAALAAELSTLHSLAAANGTSHALSRLSAEQQQAYFRALPTLTPRYSYSSHLWS